MKYGFAAFAKRAIPLDHPKRPFDIKRDLKMYDKVLVYVTPSGLISKNKKWPEQEALFMRYMPDRGLVQIVLDNGPSKVIHISYIRVKNDA